jgi:hypothetical protein
MHIGHISLLVDLLWVVLRVGRAWLAVSLGREYRRRLLVHLRLRGRRVSGIGVLGSIVWHGSVPVMGLLELGVLGHDGGQDRDKFGVGLDRVLYYSRCATSAQTRGEALGGGGLMG